jgi:hypothetical protein
MKKSPSTKMKSRGQSRRKRADQLTAAVNLPVELKRAVDAWAENQNVPRSEAVSRLVQRGLQAWIEELG